jgi:hypothetical protein
LLYGARKNFMSFKTKANDDDDDDDDDMQNVECRGHKRATETGARVESSNGAKHTFFSCPLHEFKEFSFSKGVVTRCSSGHFARPCHQQVKCTAQRHEGNEGTAGLPPPAGAADSSTRPERPSAGGLHRPSAEGGAAECVCEWAHNCTILQAQGPRCPALPSAVIKQVKGGTNREIKAGTKLDMTTHPETLPWFAHR